VDDVKARMHGKMKSTPEEIFAAIEGYITPTQRKFFSHVMNVIREQTSFIEITDEMIKDSFCDEQKFAVEKLDEIRVSVLSARNRSLPKPVRT